MAEAVIVLVEPEFNDIPNHFEKRVRIAEYSEQYADIKALSYNRLMTDAGYEATTHGVWNRILNDVFKYPTYLVIPKWHFDMGTGKEGGTADIAVKDLVNNRIVILYEGKRRGGNVGKMTNALKQAQNAAEKKFPYTALIAAAGPSFSMTDVYFDTLSEFYSIGGEPQITENNGNLKMIVSNLLMIRECKSCCP